MLKKCFLFRKTKTPRLNRYNNLQLFTDQTVNVRQFYLLVYHTVFKMVSRSAFKKLTPF